MSKCVKVLKSVVQKVLTRRSFNPCFQNVVEFMQEKTNIGVLFSMFISFARKQSIRLPAAHVERAGRQRPGFNSTKRHNKDRRKASFLWGGFQQ